MSSTVTSLTTFLSLVAQILLLKLRKPPRWLSLTSLGLNGPDPLSHFVPVVPRVFGDPGAATTGTQQEVAITTDVRVPPSPRGAGEAKGLPRSPRNNASYAARLPFFIHQWRQVTSNKWILNVVENGYKLQFDPDPPPPRPFVRTSYSPSSSSIIRTLLIDYMDKGAIMVVDIRPDQYVSRIFEVPKKTGDYRLILDLSDLNCFLKKVHFKMEGLPSIASLISLNDFMASLDLQDAFLTVAIYAPQLL